MLETASQVNEHLTEMRTSGRTLRNEQLIVMTVLNYRHQLNTLKAENQAQTEQLNKQIKKLQHAISGALDKNTQKPDQKATLSPIHEKTQNIKPNTARNTELEIL